jgi:hypothetical protein
VLLRVAVVGGYVYIADGDAGLRIFDMSLPSDPVNVGFYDTAGSASGVAVAGNHIYIADYRGGFYNLAYAPFTTHLPLVLK